MPKIYPSSHASVKKHNSLNFIAASKSQGSQTRITCEPIVANELDTLKLSFWIDWSNSSLLDRLEFLKSKAQEGEEQSIPVDLAGHEWNCMRSGAANFNYRLIRGDIRLLLNRRKPSDTRPNLRLEIGSLSCWSPGYLFYYNQIIELIELFGGGIIKEGISEVHLAADIIGFSLENLPIDKQDHWIARGHKFSVYHDRCNFTGIVIGAGDLMLRIYDKVEELKNSTHKQTTFADIWGLRSFDQNPVTRVEFQLRKRVLRQLKPRPDETLDDLVKALDSIWHYCTSDWCRLTTKSVDRNHHQSRAAIHPFWQLVQSVNWSGGNTVIRSKCCPQKDILRLRQQARGIIMSIAAIDGLPPDDIEAIIATGHKYIETDLREGFRDKTEFMKKMQRKINESHGPAC